MRSRYDCDVRLISEWLDRCALDPIVRLRAAEVLGALPPPVLEDLIADPSFTMCDFEPGPGRVFHVPMQLKPGSGPGRAVVLKRTLRSRPQEFARWVIAHELAHAHLRNRGRFPGEDPERAADDLAATWGFPRPLR